MHDFPLSIVLYVSFGPVFIVKALNYSNRFEHFRSDVTLFQQSFLDSALLPEVIFEYEALFMAPPYKLVLNFLVVFSRVTFIYNPQARSAGEDRQPSDEPESQANNADLQTDAEYC